VSLAKTEPQELQAHLFLDCSGSTKDPTTFDRTPSGDLKVGEVASEKREEEGF